MDFAQKYTDALIAIEQDPNLSAEGKYQAKLEVWYNWDLELAALKEAEMGLRKDLFGQTFPNPVEGSGNKLPLQGGWIVQGTYNISRKIDEAVYLNHKAKFAEAGIPEDVVKFKPELSKGEYNKLNDKQKKLFDKCLEIKPGSPALEVKKPKRSIA